MKQMFLWVKIAAIRVVRGYQTVANLIARPGCAKDDHTAAESSSREPSAYSPRIHRGRDKSIDIGRTDADVIPQTLVRRHE